MHNYNDNSTIRLRVGGDAEDTSTLLWVKDGGTLKLATINTNNGKLCVIDKEGNELDSIGYTLVHDEDSSDVEFGNSNVGGSTPAGIAAAVGDLTLTYTDDEGNAKTITIYDSDNPEAQIPDIILPTGDFTLACTLKNAAAPFWSYTINYGDGDIEFNNRTSHTEMLDADLPRSTVTFKAISYAERATSELQFYLTVDTTAGQTEEPENPDTPDQPGGDEPDTPDEPGGSGGSHRPARDDGPSTGASDGWKDIRDEIADAEDGDTITIDMGDETEVPGEIFEEVAGKDVTVEFELEDGVSWTVNGQDIPTDTGLSDLDLGVSMDSRGIPVNVFNAITGEYSTVQFTLSHDGPFGFTLTLAAPLGRDNAGYWANLYYYHEKGRELEFQQAARIGRDGRAEFRMDHASQYAVVIDDKSHEPEPLPFSDVPEDHWAYDAIQYVYGEGLMAGTGETTFSPNGTTTRGQIVTILWRLAGSPQVNYLMDFSDVAPAAWYGEAVRWASALRIASGYGDGRFGPNDPITREQLAVMLYQYAWNMGYDLTGGGMALREYGDYDQISGWALEALDWAVHTGLLGGKGGGILDPTGGATRAQVAQILMNFCAHAAEWPTRDQPSGGRSSRSAPL